MEWNAFWDRGHLAEYYRNEALMNGKTAAVHLESAEDEDFWNGMLQLNHPGSYHYIYSSKSKRGNETSGRPECLSFCGFLDKFFFVCIDSDTDSVRKGRNSRTDDFVLQTYAYSWESLFCHIPELQTRFSEINIHPKRDFDFSVFLSQYSKTVIKGLAMAVEDEKKTDDSVFNILSSILETQCQADEMLNNGELYVKSIENELSDYATSSGKESGIKKGLEVLRKRGIDESNAYLYVRGHNLYDIVVYIGKRCCSQKGLKL